MEQAALNDDAVQFTEEGDMANNQFCHTGGYWLMSSERVPGAFPVNRVADIAFDPIEELVWSVTSAVSQRLLCGFRLRKLVRAIDATTKNSTYIT